MLRIKNDADKNRDKDDSFKFDNTYDSRNKYIDLKVNGRLFPSWILANYLKKTRQMQINCQKS